MPFEEPGKEIDMKEQPGKSDRVDVPGIEHEWKLKRNDTVDQYCVLAATMQPGAGVPLHQHPQQEAFFTLEGQAQFAVENGAGLAWKEVHPEDMINIPPDAGSGTQATAT
jgi:quercetin dioxygenase-like cupin family protein